MFLKEDEVLGGLPKEVRCCALRSRVCRDEGPLSFTPPWASGTLGRRAGVVRDTKVSSADPRELCPVLWPMFPLPSWGQRTPPSGHRFLDCVTARACFLRVPWLLASGEPAVVDVLEGPPSRGPLYQHSPAAALPPCRGQRPPAG